MGQLLHYLQAWYHLWHSASSQLPFKPHGPPNPSPASTYQIPRFPLTDAKILAWTFITLRLITLIHCTIWWPSCFPEKSPMEHSKGKSKTTDPDGCDPGHIHLLCNAEWTTHAAKAWPKRTFQLNKVQVSEAQVLLQGSCTSAHNTEIRGFLAIWLPWQTQDRSTPPRCYLETTAPTTFLQKNGKALASTHLTRSKASLCCLKVPPIPVVHPHWTSWPQQGWQEHTTRQLSLDLRTPKTSPK